MKKSINILWMLILIINISGCGAEENKEIVVAEQYGLAYAPIVIMSEKGFLEEAVKDSYTVRWMKLGNTAAIREAMLTEELDIGFMGIPPFLIGVDQGMEWKVISGLSKSPLGLISNDARIDRLEALKGAGKIALPQPGSIQHILLSMAAQREFGEATYFDDQLISMKHPDGLTALKSGHDIKAHFTSPPYLFEEMDNPDYRLLLDGEEAFGGSFTFIVGVCRPAFREDEEAYNAFLEALNRSIRFIYEEKNDSILILSAAFELPPETVEDYLYGRGMVFTEEVEGVSRFIGFMRDAGYLDNDFEEEGVLW